MAVVTTICEVYAAGNLLALGSANSFSNLILYRFNLASKVTLTTCKYFTSFITCISPLKIPFASKSSA